MTNGAVNKTQNQTDNRTIVTGFHYISLKLATSAPTRTGRRKL
jgi:hypothetical protein